MANVEKQKPSKNDGGQQLQRREQPSEIARTERMPVAVREPFDLMRDFMRWDPFRALRSDFLVRDPFREMRELMRDMMSLEPEYRERAWRPEFEVRENDNQYVIRGDVPGLRAEDLEVSVSGDQIQISGKRELKEEQTEGTYHAYERAYGSFVRTFALPDSVDAEKISCELNNGVVEIVLPKKPGAEPPRRKIEIKSGQGQAA